MVPPRGWTTWVTVSLIRASVRQPVPVAPEVKLVPWQGWPFPGDAQGLSAAAPFATAWRAPWRAASATVLYASSIRMASISPIRTRKSTRRKQRELHHALAARRFDDHLSTELSPGYPP